MKIILTGLALLASSLSFAVSNETIKDAMENNECNITGSTP